MAQLDKVLYTAHAHTTGGRGGALLRTGMMAGPTSS